MELSDEYIAGFLDGEGCFSLTKQRKKGTNNFYPSARVIVGQSGEDGKELLRDIQKKYGGLIYLHLSAGQHKATKEAWKLYWNKEEAEVLLTAIIPHLRLKKQKAIDVLNYYQRSHNGS